MFTCHNSFLLLPTTRAIRKSTSDWLVKKRWKIQKKLSPSHYFWSSIATLNLDTCRPVLPTIRSPSSKNVTAGVSSQLLALFMRQKTPIADFRTPIPYRTVTKIISIHMTKSMEHFDAQKCITRKNPITPEECMMNIVQNFGDIKDVISWFFHNVLID